MAAGVPFLVNGPRPLPPRYRLIDTATVIPEATSHWENGVQVWSYPTGVPDVFDPCSTGTDRIKADGEASPQPAFGSFVVWLAETCTARGIDPDDQDGYIARALDAFNASESYAVEREFSGGAKMGLINPYLGDANLDILNAGATTSPDAALAWLESAIAASARRGFIHAAPQVVSRWSMTQVHDVSGKLESTVGSLVASEQGLSGLIPDDAATTLVDGTDWAYATGMVDIRRSEALG